MGAVQPTVNNEKPSEYKESYQESQKKMRVHECGEQGRLPGGKSMSKVCAQCQLRDGQ